jgi:hypothetical protein
MMAKAEEEREARMEARMQAQWRAMTGETEALGAEKPPVPSMGRMAEGVVEQPSPKQIGVKTARSFMREIIAALTTADAKAALDAARTEAYASKSDDKDWQTLVQTLGPELEKRTQAIVQRYGFATDFEKAMTSVGEAQERKGDKELSSAMQYLHEIFTGEHVEIPDVGLVPELAHVAEKFLDASDHERRDSIEEAGELWKKTRDTIVKTYIDTYLEIMRGIQNEGESFVKTGISDILAAAKKDADGASRTFHERERLEIRTNILVQFLRPSEKTKFLGEPVEDSRAEL